MKTSLTERPANKEATTSLKPWMPASKSALVMPVSRLEITTWKSCWNGSGLDVTVVIAEAYGVVWAATSMAVSTAVSGVAGGADVV